MRINHSSSSRRLRSLSRRLQIFILFLAIVMLAAFPFAHALSTQYVLGNGSKTQRLEDLGYVNVCEQSISRDGIEITAIAIFTDQKQTYVKLAVKGTALKELPLVNPVSEIASEKGQWLMQRIAAATLTDGTQSLPFVPDDAHTKNDAPFLTESLRKHETILSFRGTPSKDASLDLEINFPDMEPFVIPGIFVKVPPVVVRDLSEDNLEVHLPNASGTLKQLKYTATDTILTVDWVFDDATYMRNLADFHANYSVYAQVDGEAYLTVLEPMQSDPGGLGVTCAHSLVPLHILPDCEIHILLYEQRHAQPRGKLVRELAIIPPQ